MNYYIAVFPTEKLLKEISKAEEFFDKKLLLRHYNYLNIATCDQIEMMDFVGHTYMNINHKYTRVELGDIDLHCMYGFSGFEDPIVLTENYVSRMGINIDYFKKHEEFKEGCKNIVLYPLRNEEAAIRHLVDMQAINGDIQFIALVDEFIKNEPITQAQRYQTDISIRLYIDGVLIEQTTIDIEGARAQAANASKLPLAKVFDYEMT